MKIAFWGTPDLTIPILEALRTHGYTPALIVTGPDMPQGRKLMLTPPEPKLWATAHKIPLLQPQKITPEVIEHVKQYGPFDLFVVVAYGKILPEAIINLPRFGTINIHYSLLPKYRGASPVEAALLHNEQETGVCIQQMVYELDAGDILAHATLTILPDDTTPTLRDRLNNKGAELLVKLLPDIGADSLSPIAQDHSQKTLCKKIKKEDGCIDLTTDTPQTIWNKYRAYAIWPRTYFFITHKEQKMRVILADAQMQAGTLTFKKLLPEGKKELSRADFVRVYGELPY